MHDAASHFHRNAVRRAPTGSGSGPVTAVMDHIRTALPMARPAGHLAVPPGVPSVCAANAPGHLSVRATCGTAAVPSDRAPVRPEGTATGRVMSRPLPGQR